MPKNKDNTPEIWILLDDKPGHSNQSIGVAEAIGMPITMKNIKWNRWSNMHNRLVGKSLKGVDKNNSDSLKAPWPDLVIGAGRRMAPVMRYIKSQAKKAGKDCYAVQLMWPGKPASGLDLIAIPKHDRLPLWVRKRKNIMTTIGAPHRVTATMLENESGMWQQTIGEHKQPRVALLVGGDTAEGEFTTEHAKQLAKWAASMTHTLQGSLMFTNSRRTSKEATEAFQQVFAMHDDFHVHFHDNTNARANPYYAFLALSDVIIVTGDSISMCSEACATGKPVYIYTPKGIVPKKHLRLHNNMYKGGYAYQLNNYTLSSVTPRTLSTFIPQEPLNVSQQVAERVLREVSF